MQTGVLLHVYIGHTDDVNACAFSPDERFILSASSDHTARIWETATGRCVAVFHAMGQLRACAWSHQSDRIALAGVSGVYLLQFRREWV